MTGEPLTRASLLRALLKRGLVLRATATADEIADKVRLYQLEAMTVAHDGRKITISDAIELVTGQRITFTTGERR